MISVVTPTHRPEYLKEAFDSLHSQTYQGEWEWVIVPNNDCSIGELPWDITSHDKVRIVPYYGDNRIGAIKKLACSVCVGDIIVELDHDDLLTPDALRQTAKAFHDEKVDMAYSNFAEFWTDTWKPNVFNKAFGWVTRDREFYGHQFKEQIAFQPTAASMSLVHYAPNHVRAWRRSAYDRVGGHDTEMKICDDHDLCCRFYLDGRMAHIDDCLYLYRRHNHQSYMRFNAEIQTKTKDVRDRYLVPMVERWADLKGLQKIDLGAAHNKPDGYTGVDLHDADITHDVTTGLPFEDSSVGVVRAYDFLEHIPDSIALMNEIYRVLVDGGWLISGTPSTDGRGAFQDPTHVSFWNANSFWYYTNKQYAEFVPEIQCRFQAMRVRSLFPTDFHRNNAIPYVYADLCAVKSDERRPGRVLI